MDNIEFRRPFFPELAAIMSADRNSAAQLEYSKLLRIHRCAMTVAELFELSEEPDLAAAASAIAELKAACR